MKITNLEFNNVRSFTGDFNIRPSRSINILVGQNNSGKTTVLNIIYLLQRIGALNSKDISIGEDLSIVRFTFEDLPKNLIQTDYRDNNVTGYVINLKTGSNNIVVERNEIKSLYSTNLANIEHEPNNIIYPFFSKRKVHSYSEVINENVATEVVGDFRNLVAKIDRLVTDGFEPAGSNYKRYCNEILGYYITTAPSTNGKKLVFGVYNYENIPLVSMGEGVSNIIGLIADICLASNKIFVIEEPENDIHPKALKSLMRLIVESSEENQFFISTHSNIVMKYLGAKADTKIFQTNSQLNLVSNRRMFHSSISEVGNNVLERKAVLENLGYEMYDLDLWKGWLFLEESSAEVLIRDYFIKWYFPDLKNKLKTFSAASTSNVIPKFDDFNRLFVFLHLEPSYKNRVWVVIDGGPDESIIINDLKEKYLKSGWKEEQFSQFTQHDFEKYYPDPFTEQVQRVLSISNKKEKRESKRLLLESVKDWIKDNEVIAIEAFRESAKEIIAKIETIAAALE